MTLKPLADDFALASPLATRPPHAVDRDELRVELEEELARRRRVYPGLVDRGTMKRDEADHHIVLWAAMLHDHRRANGDREADPYAYTWDARVRELRRELALRRAAFPKWIASATNPLTETEAARRLDRLDALHWRYWMDLFAFSPPGQAMGNDHLRARHIAERELARRLPALDAALGMGGAEAAVSNRIRNHLIVLARVANHLDAGRARATIVTRADLFRLGDTIDALIDVRIPWTEADGDAALGQLARLHKWLVAQRDAAPSAPAIIERKAA